MKPFCLQDLCRAMLSVGYPILFSSHQPTTPDLKNIAPQKKKKKLKMFEEFLSLFERKTKKN